MPGKSGNLGQFWQELKRRKVVRVITVYAAASFVILELVSIITEPLQLPDWTLAMVIVLLCIGFVIAVILSWVYDITPEGIEKTKPVKEVSKAAKPTVSLTWKIATYVSFAIILAFTVFYFLNTRKTPGSQAEIGKSIAVLPFMDMSPQKDQEYFCDGITEELINSLTQLEGLKVIARTSSFAFKGKHEDIREIGRKLDVETLLEGSVQKSGAQLRITAQLIRVEDGSHLWSQQYDRALEDVFAIQDEISMAITDILKVKLLGDEKNSIKNRQTSNIEAYNLYLRGRYFWNLRTEEAVRRSIDYYNQAIELDANYALAYAGLADTYFIMAWWGYYPKEEGYKKGQEYAKQALSLNENIAEAHATLGGIATWYEWDWEKSVQELQRAISLNPNYATAHQYYSETLDILKNYKASRVHIDMALNLNPNAYMMYSLSSMYYYHTADYKRTIEEGKRAIEISHHIYPDLRILCSYFNLGMTDSALVQIKNIVSSGTSDLTQLDDIFRNSGIKGAITWFIEWLLVNESKGSLDITSINYRVASLYAIMEDKEKTFWYLEKVMREGEENVPRINSNPDFDFIRDDPRFKALLKEMRLLD